jgi:hypothetical protein
VYYFLFHFYFATFRFFTSNNRNRQNVNIEYTNVARIKKARFEHVRGISKTAKKKFWKIVSQGGFPMHHLHAEGAG